MASCRQSFKSCSIDDRDGLAVLRFYWPLYTDLGLGTAIFDFAQRYHGLVVYDSVCRTWRAVFEYFLIPHLNAV